MTGQIPSGKVLFPKFLAIGFLNDSTCWITTTFYSPSPSQPSCLAFEDVNTGEKYSLMLSSDHVHSLIDQLKQLQEEPLQGSIPKKETK